MGFFEGIMGLGGSILGHGGAMGEEAKENNEYVQMLKDLGVLDPAAVREVEAEQQGESAANRIRVDPRIKDARMRALKGMEGVYGANGMDAESAAQLHQINSDVGQQDKARRDAIVASQARKGRGTGGAAYSALMSGAQTAATAQADAAHAAHAAARQRALQAMSGAGKMAGDMQADDFGEQAHVAGQNDRINQFNTQLRQQAQLQNQQRDQQVVQNRFAKANATNDVRLEKAGMHRRRADGHRQRGYGWGKAAGATVDSMVGGMGGGGGGFGGMFGGGK